LEEAIMKTKTSRRTSIPATYAGLVAQFMPRPLHDEIDYQNALATMDTLAGFKLNADQEDYFDAIATFVERYEAEHHSLKDVTMTPIELIRSLMVEHDMNASDLGRLLGDRSLGHRILSGERELSKVHIRLLAEHFRLNPGALL
jgi:HTH-type transcriptional regulator / antitoxin HigA